MARLKCYQCLFVEGGCGSNRMGEGDDIDN